MKHENRVYYNIAEANNLIPRLEYLFAKLARIQRSANAVQEKAAERGIQIKFEENGEKTGGRFHDKITGLSKEYSDVVDEINRLGVVIEDIDMGVVSFYSWIGGAEILLSWQFGENEITHWHTVKETASARRPFDDQPAIGHEVVIH